MESDIMKKTSNIILITMGLFMLLFIITMIVTFWVKGAVPDTLIQYTLGAGGIEATALAGIKIVKVITNKTNDGDDENENV